VEDSPGISVRTNRVVHGDSRTGAAADTTNKNGARYRLITYDTKYLTSAGAPAEVAGRRDSSSKVPPFDTIWPGCHFYHMINTNFSMEGRRG